MPEQNCHHCGHVWQSRKEKPVKCSRCQNPLWKSPRPKKQRQVIDQNIDIGVFDPDHPDMADEVANVTECVRAPEEKDSLSQMKQRAESLLSKLI